MRRLVLSALIVAATAAIGCTRVADPAPVVQAAAPGTGLICIWAIQATLLEVGKSCDGPRNLAFEAELARSVSRIEGYALRQSPGGAGGMANYRMQRLERDAAACEPDALEMYREMSRTPPETLRAETERLLASSPAVEWGTCL